MAGGFFHWIVRNRIKSNRSATPAVHQAFSGNGKEWAVNKPFLESGTLSRTKGYINGIPVQAFPE